MSGELGKLVRYIKVALALTYNTARNCFSVPSAEQSRVLPTPVAVRIEPGDGSDPIKPKDTHYSSGLNFTGQVSKRGSEGLDSLCIYNSNNGFLDSEVQGTPDFIAPEVVQGPMTPEQRGKTAESLAIYSQLLHSDEIEGRLTEGQLKQAESVLARYMGKDVPKPEGEQ